MRLAQQDSTGKWVVFYNDQPIAISGQTQFDSREDAVAQIATRGLSVKPDGEIYRPVEPVQFQAPEPVEAEPETAPAPEREDLCAICGEYPSHVEHNHPEPEPVSSEDLGLKDDFTLPEFEEAVAKTEPDEILPYDAEHGFVTGHLVEPIVIEEDDAPAWGAGTETIEVEFKDADPEFIAMMANQPEPDAEVEAVIAKAEKIPADPEPEQPKGKRGRPRVYSPEEAAARRREQNRKYYHARKEARKAEVSERSKEWWETHPEKISEYREKANEKRRSRYADDPEYRAKVSAYNREYQAKKRAERQAAREAAKTPPEV